MRQRKGFLQRIMQRKFLLFLTLPSPPSIFFSLLKETYAQSAGLTTSMLYVSSLYWLAMQYSIIYDDLSTGICAELSFSPWEGLTSPVLVEHPKFRTPWVFDTPPEGVFDTLSY